MERNLLTAIPNIAKLVIFMLREQRLSREILSINSHRNLPECLTADKRALKQSGEDEAINMI
jgi:hypothetical protein